LEKSEEENAGKINKNETRAGPTQGTNTTFNSKP